MIDSRTLCLVTATLVAFPAGLLAGNQGYPQHANVVNVTRAPYSAKGEGAVTPFDGITRLLRG